MKEEIKKPKDLILTDEEENLFSKYIEEYNDTYPKILLLNPLEFFQNILKGLEISLKENINGFSQESKTKIEEYIIQKYILLIINLLHLSEKILKIEILLK